MAIRILLADDHAIVRAGFRNLLEKQRDMEVVGEANDGRDAIQIARQLKPDVIIMDVAMPELNGIDASRQITREFPDIKVLALSMHSSHRVVSQMLRAGASGYLVKTCTVEELVRAVRAVNEGKTYLSPEIASGLVEDYMHRVPAGDDDTPATLSDREREVLQLVAEGKTTKEIASLLHVSVKTVEGHRHSIMEKLALHSIAELTKYAVREGLTPLES